MPIKRNDEGHWMELDHFAEITHGFVGADLAALAREAAMSALRRYLPEIDLDEPIPSKLLQEMEVRKDDFKEALKDVEPSALREIMVEIPKVKWDEVGGLDEVKQKYTLFIMEKNYGKYVLDELSVACYWTNKFSEAKRYLLEIIDDEDFKIHKDRLDKNMKYLLTKD